MIFGYVANGGPVNGELVHNKDRPLAPGDTLKITRPSRYLGESECAVYKMNENRELHFDRIDKIKKPRFEPWNIGIFWFHASEASDKSIFLTVTDADDSLIAMLPGSWPANLDETQVKAISGWWLLNQMRVWAAKAEELYRAIPHGITSLPETPPTDPPA